MLEVLNKVICVGAPIFYCFVRMNNRNLKAGLGCRQLRISLNLKPAVYKKNNFEKMDYLFRKRSGHPVWPKGHFLKKILYSDILSIMNKKFSHKKVTLLLKYVGYVNNP